LTANPSVTGIDVDWEFPQTTSQKESLTLFVQALRTTFGSDFGISVAVTPAYYLNYYDFPSLNDLVTNYKHMGYDFGTQAKANGPIDPRSDAPQQTLWILNADHSIPFSVSGAIAEMIALGADPSKIEAELDFYCGESTDSAVSRKPYWEVVDSLSLKTAAVDPNTREVIVGDTTCPSPESVAQKITVLHERFNIMQFGAWELGYDNNLELTNALVSGQSDLGPAPQPAFSPSVAPSIWLSSHPSFAPSVAPVGDSPTSFPTGWDSTITTDSTLCTTSTAYSCVGVRTTYGNGLSAALKAEVLPEGHAAGVSFDQ
jgi:hypothetical protein